MLEFIEMYFDDGTHKHIATKKTGSKWTLPQNDFFAVFDKNHFKKTVKYLPNNYCDRFHLMMIVVMLEESTKILTVFTFITKEAYVWKEMDLKTKGKIIVYIYLPGPEKEKENLTLAERYLMCLNLR